MRIIDWSSDVCSSDLASRVLERLDLVDAFEFIHDIHACQYVPKPDPSGYRELCERYAIDPCASLFFEDMARNLKPAKAIGMTTVWVNNRSEEHTSELQSLMRISYAVFCLKKTKHHNNNIAITTYI